MSEPTLRLYADGLLSRYGFNDGGLPDDFLDYMETVHGDLDYDRGVWDRVLIRLVKEKLLPVIAHYDVKVYTIETSHNPIRAESVGCIKVDVRAEYQDLFNEEYVDISMAEVFAIYEESRRG